MIWGYLKNIVPKGTNYIHLLWALLFLKLYTPEAALSGMVRVDEKIYRKHVWIILKSISSLKRLFVNLEDRFEGDNGSDCLMSVDGTDFKIQQPTPFDKKWFSHKFKSSGLRYEIALCIQTGVIVWCNGPFPCGDWPDITIYRGWLKSKLIHGERLEADFGYRGDRTIDDPETNCSAIEQKRKKRAVRGRQETVNARLKIFGALSQVYRHKRSCHHIVFWSAIVLTQLCLKYEKPLSPVVHSTERRNI